MKLISFLGIANYQTTTYVWQEQELETRFFPVAAAHFLQPAQMLVCATPTVEKHANLSELTNKLAEANVNYRVVPIPEGHSEADLWRIFDALTGVVEERETVAFDVTHSFRSLPFLSFLAVAYLQVAKKVRVERVLYGAFEAHDNTNHSPVFDLTPFVTLLDWLTATDQFVKTGDARRLAQMLGADKSKRAAMQASEKLSRVSLAAFLCQPFTLMQEAQSLGAVLQQAQPELAEQTLPFDVMREQITNTFGAFGADWSKNQSDGLRAQFRLIEWYYQNNQLIQAMTLAREWLISAVTLRLGLAIDLASNPRRQMERALSGVALVGHDVRDEQTGEKYVFQVSDLNAHGRVIYDTWAERDELIFLWQVADVRNALNHAEHKKGAMSLEKIAKKAELLKPRLQTLAIAWGFADGDSSLRSE